MVETCIYCGLVFLMFILAFVKKANVLLKVLLSTYLIVALFAVYLQKENLLLKGQLVTFLPYLELILAYVVFFFPFFKSGKHLNSKRITEDISPIYIVILYIFIACSALYIINFIPKVITLVSTGSWRNNYDNMIVNAEGVKFEYINGIFWLATQISSYISLLVLILSFVLLRNKKHMKLAIVTLVMYIVCHFISAASASSRGVIFITVMLLFSMFLFFFPTINGKIRNLLIVFGLLTVFFAMLYLIDVTVSRFTQKDAFDSVLAYFGQAPIVFNYGVATIEEPCYGTYTLGALIGRAVDASVRRQWGDGFYTFVGWAHIDWGFIGVFVYGIIAAIFNNYFTSKKQYKISDLLVIFHFFSFLLNGAFVIGPTQIISLLMMLLLYVLCKIFVDGKIRWTLKTKNSKNRVKENIGL